MFFLTTCGNLDTSTCKSKNYVIEHNKCNIKWLNVKFNVKLSYSQFNKFKSGKKMVLK